MNKEIEQLSQEIVNICPETKDDYCSEGTCYYCLAKGLYNAGYRKIDGIKAQAQDLICKAVLNGSNEKKKAIKEFSEQLRIKISKINNRPYDTMHHFEVVDMLDSECETLLKEYGIDEEIEK